MVFFYLFSVNMLKIDNRDKKKRVHHSNFVIFLTLYGVGLFNVRKKAIKKGLNPKSYFLNLKKSLSNQVKSLFKFFLLGKNLKKDLNEYFKFLWNFRLYKGYRYQFNLPLRGQRTKTNAKTAKFLKKKLVYEKKFISK